MATVMSNPYREKVRLPSISSITGPHNDRLPSLASITGASPPLPLAPTQDPLSTLRAAANIFASEHPLPQGQDQGQGQGQDQREAEIQQQQQQERQQQLQARATPPSTKVTSATIKTPGKAPVSHTQSPSTSPSQMYPTPTMTQMHTFQPQPVYHTGPATFHQPQTPPYAPAHYNSYTAVPTQHFEAFPPQNLAQTQPQQLQRQPLSRTRLRTQQACQRCGITETPEWRKGPNGARTLCNACGLFHAKVLKRDGPEAAAYAIMNSTITKRKQLQRRHTAVPQQMPMITMRHGVPIIPPGSVHHPQYPPLHYQLQPGQVPLGQAPPGQMVQFLPGPDPHHQGHPHGYSPLPPPNMGRK